MLGQVHLYVTQQLLRRTSTRMESSGQVYGGGGQSHGTALQSVVVPASGLRQTLGEGVAVGEREQMS